MLAFQLEVFLEQHTDLANSYKAAYCLGPSLLGIARERAGFCQRSNTSLTMFSAQLKNTHKHKIESQNEGMVEQKK